MFNTFIDVIVELWSFVFANRKPELLALPGQVASSETETVVLNNDVRNHFSVGTISESFDRPAYVSVTEASCYVEPAIDFDTKLFTLSYGELVNVKSLKDGMAKIKFSNYEGWVKTSELVDDKNSILPNLKSAYIYGPKNDETIKLRKYLKDDLLGDFLNLPLQPLELICYLLRVNNITANWSKLRPRRPGSIHTALKGQKNVVISIEPRTNAIIEFTDEKGKGVLGFVREVSPDLNINFVSVGRVEAGEYRVEKFTHAEWKEWRPVFISFV